MSTKQLWVLIGPSGSGKSTITERIIKSNSDRPVRIHSMDTLRLNWYGSDYSTAWLTSTRDTEFGSKVRNDFDQLLLDQCDIIVDNTNLTPKSRKRYVTEAKKRGYTTIGVVFNVPLPVLLERQRTRPDKTVPESAVIRQAQSLVLPNNDEFDVILRAEDV